MTNSKKEINVACNYLLRLIKAHVELSAEQIQQFKRVFFDTLSKRFVGHWFPATPHRGSAFRCLQTKHWKDPILRTIAERSSLPLHRYLPAIFTMWIDPGEVAVCFGDDGTWCSLYATDMDGGDLHQDYSDGEETVSSLSSDEDLQNLTQNVQTLTINQHHPVKSVPHVDSDHSRSSSSLASRSSSPYFHPTDPQLHSQPSGTDSQPFSFWPSTWTTPDSWLLYHQEEKPFC